MKKQVKINGLEKGKEREDMKKKKQKTACCIVCCRYCGRYRSTAMTPVYAAQNEVTNEEAVNAEVMSAGNNEG